MSAFLDVVASANVRDTLSIGAANQAVRRVIGQLPSAGHKPELLGLQEWNRGAPDCIKGSAYRFVRAQGGGGPAIYESTRYGLLWSRTKTLARPGFVGHIPGRRSTLEKSKAAIYCFADELGTEDVVLIVAHLTAEVQKGRGYRGDRLHRLRVLRHRAERYHLGIIARTHVHLGRRVYVTVDTNFDSMTLKPLVSCWDSHRREEAAGTLGGRTVDYVYAPDDSASVRRVGTASDHDAVVATYVRRRA